MYEYEKVRRSTSDFLTFFSYCEGFSKTGSLCTHLNPHTYTHIPNIHSTVCTYIFLKQGWCGQPILFILSKLTQVQLQQDLLLFCFSRFDVLSSVWKTRSFVNLEVDPKERSDQVSESLYMWSRSLYVFPWYT